MDTARIRRENFKRIVRVLKMYQFKIKSLLSYFSVATKYSFIDIILRVTNKNLLEVRHSYSRYSCKIRIVNVLQNFPNRYSNKLGQVRCLSLYVPFAEIANVLTCCYTNITRIFNVRDKLSTRESFRKMNEPVAVTMKKLAISQDRISLAETRPLYLHQEHLQQSTSIL